MMRRTLARREAALNMALRYVCDPNISVSTPGTLSDYTIDLAAKFDKFLRGAK